MNPLRSLADMLELYADQFYSATQWLTEGYSRDVKHYFAPGHSLASVKGTEYAKKVREMFEGIARACDDLECPGAAGRTRFLLQLLDGRAEHAVDECEEIAKTLLFELANKKFLYIQGNVSRFYEKPLSFIGTEEQQTTMLNRFPTIYLDLIEASKCYALERPTASAFHLMRGLEHVVFALAKALSVSIPNDRNWNPILDGCNRAIERKNQTRPQWVKDKQAHLEGVVAALQSYRSAWRNPTMHVEQTYTAEEALGFLIMGGAFFRGATKAFEGQP